jgi:hypothetical protein
LDDGFIRDCSPDLNARPARASKSSEPVLSLIPHNFTFQRLWITEFKQRQRQFLLIIRPICWFIGAQRRRSQVRATRFIQILAPILKFFKKFADSSAKNESKKSGENES